MGKNLGQHAFHNARSKKEQKAEVARLFERAVTLQKAGLLPDALAVYRQLLQLAPKHFDALYQLGMAEYHARSFQQAEQLLSKAVDVEPRSAKAHLDRGTVLCALRRLEEAGVCFRRAIILNPGDAAALNDLGNVCWELHRLDEAIETYDKALAIKPDFPKTWHNRGLVLNELGRYEEALASHDRAVAFDSQYAEAWNCRGMALRALERPAEALDSYERALAINPDFPEVLYNRGNILRALGHLVEARDSFDKALAIKPNFPEALNGSGVASTNLRDYDTAIASFTRALAVRPDYAEAFANRAAAWQQLKNFNAAFADYDRALALAPGLAVAWAARASALSESGRTSEAIACCERALSLDPRSYHAHTLTGQCLAALGRIDEAIGKFDDALAIKPDFEDAILVKIFNMDYVPTADFVQHRDARHIWWERIGSKIPALPPAEHRNIQDPNRRLVIGYVSSDFMAHSAALAFRPALQHYDHSQFETVCYSCSPGEDKVTEEFRNMAGRWRNASQWSDDRLADQIRQDGVDILVDLSGHTNGHRLGVFARKPAPIQVHGWGHVMPPGLPTIDYVFADPVAIPPEVRHLFVETIYDLPCMLTLDPLPADVPRAELPALANGFVTFGVFNRINKISDSSAAAWAQILQRVARSRLLIKHFALGDPLVREYLLARFARHGVAPERIDLLGSTPRSEHLAALNKVDICWDPFPQNGGVSTWEPLQMGVPVVALLGNALSGRAGGAIVTAVGLADWVAESQEEYIEISVTRASRLGELAELRRTLPGRIAASAAGNHVAYAGEVAKAYRSMWWTYCAKRTDQPQAGAAAKPIDVNASSEPPALLMHNSKDDDA